MAADTTAELRGSIFAANSTIISPEQPTYIGGGVYNNGGVLAVTASTFRGNRADHYGGLANSGTLSLEESTLAENRAGTGYGGGFGMIAGNAAVVDTSFANNEATANIGGGIAVIDGTVLIEQSAIRNNRGAWGGRAFTLIPTLRPMSPCVTAPLPAMKPPHRTRRRAAPMCLVAASMAAAM